MTLYEWTNTGSNDFFTKKLRVLATNDLPAEKWSSNGRDDYNILKNYMRFTFEKLADEKADAPAAEQNSFIYEDSEQACFDTGLFDKNWQHIYFYCKKNRYPNYQKYEFSGFFNDYTIKMASLPATVVSALRRPNYFSDPSALIYNVNLSIVPQWQHIIYTEESFLRIPEQIRMMGPDMCRNVISGSIETVQKRIQANYKTIVPQWFNKKIQLLAPLYLTNPNKPDLALVLSLSEDKTQYYGHTCLTTEMAYNNARLIARPESYWLQP